MKSLISTRALLAICFLALSTVVFSESSEDNRVTLQISKQTKLVGTEDITSEHNGRIYYSFLGIPYAEPPVDQNRWTESKLLELSKPEYDARQFGEICVQWTLEKEPKLIGGEDCLFVNVFTTNLQKSGTELTQKKKLLTVMVYIHGGGFIIGASNVVGPKFMLRHDVILVTLNYRLGVLGYLSTGNKNLPGNYGSLDQITALDWVQKYIHHFGGDPDSVTIFGHSAGGASVHLLTMSPRALGKYHKAIVQSGTALSPWTATSPEKTKINAKTFVNLVSCPQKISDPELINCLKNKSTEELLKAQRSRIDFWVSPVMVNVVVDRESRGSAAFLPDFPNNIMDKGLYHPTAIMAGIVEHEGLMIYAALQLASDKRFGDDEYFLNVVIPRIVKGILPYGYESEVPRVIELVLREYFPEKVLVGEKDRIARVTQIYSDFGFNSGNRDMLQKYGAKSVNQVYSYVFTYRGLKSPSMIWQDVEQIRKMGIDHELFNTAATHVDDMHYLFDHCAMFPGDPNQTFTSEHLKFADYITGIWAAFAKDGNPNEGIKRGNGFDAWEPVGSGSVNYYNLTNVPAPMGSDFEEARSKFWTNIIQSLDQQKRTSDEL